MKYYLGIDGGGTKTTALLCDETGKDICCVTGGGINYLADGMQQSRQNLIEIIERVLKMFPVPIERTVIGCAALSGRADHNMTVTLCKGVIPCDKIILDSDVWIALAAADVPAPKAIAVCGTGSMAAGMLPEGKIFTSGGWGHLLGDEGSGYALSLDAVKVVCRAADGIVPSTLLTDAVLSFFNVSDPAQLIDIFYGSFITKDKIASFAPAFFDCVNKGDPVAVEIMETGVNGFGKTVSALLFSMPEGSPLYLWGGLFEHYAVYRDTFIEFIKTDHSKTDVGLLPNPPEKGAVLAAIRMED